MIYLVKGIVLTFAGVNFVVCYLTLNPIALRTAKTLWSFGCSECNRVKGLKVKRMTLAECRPKYKISETASADASINALNY